MPLATKQIVIISYAAYLVLLSLITFIAYGVDKKKASDILPPLKEAGASCSMALMNQA